MPFRRCQQGLPAGKHRRAHEVPGPDRQALRHREEHAQIQGHQWLARYAKAEAALSSMNCAAVVTKCSLPRHRPRCSEVRWATCIGSGRVRRATSARRSADRQQPGRKRQANGVEPYLWLRQVVRLAHHDHRRTRRGPPALESRGGAVDHIRRENSPQTIKPRLAGFCRHLQAAARSNGMR